MSEPLYYYVYLKPPHSTRLTKKRFLTFDEARSYLVEKTGVKNPTRLNGKRIRYYVGSSHLGLSFPAKHFSQRWYRKPKRIQKFIRAKVLGLPDSVPDEEIVKILSCGTDGFALHCAVLSYKLRHPELFS